MQFVPFVVVMEEDQDKEEEGEEDEEGEADQSITGSQLEEDPPFQCIQPEAQDVTRSKCSLIANRAD